MKIKIYGTRYSEIPKYYDWDKEKIYDYYDSVAEEKWEIEADTLTDGEKWLAKNHPDMYMGGAVSCENGDFACLAVPCLEYGKGNYETIQARINWVKTQKLPKLILVTSNKRKEGK